MSQSGENLVVRQHERLSCALHAELLVAPEHAERVMFSSAASEVGGVLSVTMIDLSSGGVGFRSKVFVPKQARMIVRISVPGASAAGSGPLRFETTVRIQRVQMLDRTPMYYLGASFVADGPAHGATVESLMKAVRDAAAVAAASAGGGA